MKRILTIGCLIFLILGLGGCGLEDSYSQEQIKRNSERSQMVDDVLSCINTPNDPNCVDRAVAKNDPNEKMITQEYNAIQNENITACNQIPDEQKKESCKMNIYINTDDVEKCNSLKNSKSFGAYKDECILQIAKKLERDNLCNQISDISSRKDACLKFFKDKNLAGIGLNEDIFEGDNINAPEFLKVYSSFGISGTVSEEITWWAKDFKITNVLEGSVDGLSGAHLYITTKGGYSTVIKIKLMSDMDVLFDGDTQYGGKFACDNNPSCNGIPWTVQTHILFDTGQTTDYQFLYCPDSISECLKLKGWMKNY